MSTVFLFGAGASAYSGGCSPYTPPLGKDLFRALQRAGTIAKAVETDLAELFERDFEAGMAEFRTRHPARIVHFLREMAAHFANFEPLETNHYRHLVRVIAHFSEPTVLSTLNYELLLELAVVREGHLVTYGGLPTSPRNLSVLKLHGSCNLWPDFGLGGFRNINFVVPPGASIVNAPIRVVNSTLEVLRLCQAEDSIAPVMGLYAEGKDVLFGRNFVREQQTVWSEEVKRARQLFVIGVRVHAPDAHIWEPLASSAAELFYVGPDPRPFLDWATKNDRPRAVHLADSFEAALPHIQRKLSRR